MRDNECWPSTLVNDPGFALHTHDPWYTANQDRQSRDSIAEGLYLEAPEAEYTMGKVNRPGTPGYNRRRAPSIEDVTFSDGNKAQKLSDEEIANRLGIPQCLEAGCGKEVERVEELVRQDLRIQQGHPIETTAQPTVAAHQRGINLASEARHPSVRSDPPEMSRRHQPSPTAAPEQ